MLCVLMLLHLLVIRLLDMMMCIVICLVSGSGSWCGVVRLSVCGLRRALVLACLRSCRLIVVHYLLLFMVITTCSVGRVWLSRMCRIASLWDVLICCVTRMTLL